MSVLRQLSTSGCVRAQVRIPLQASCRRSFASAASQARTAIVTGSARGIGKAIALRLARDGYDVTVCDQQNAENLIEETVSEIKDLGRQAYGHIADVSSQEAVEGLVQASVKELGPLTTMVANAGIVQVKPMLEVTADDFQRMLNVNLTGVQYSFQAAAKQMVQQGGGGKLIAASSTAGFKPFHMLGHYGTTKWAVRGLTQMYALELAQHKITANAYAPGIVDTKMWELIDASYAKYLGLKVGDVFKKSSQELIALGRPSVPEDVAKLVSFLASQDADYITGQTYIVDGGIIYT